MCQMATAILPHKRLCIFSQPEIQNISKPNASHTVQIISEASKKMVRSDSVHNAVENKYAYL